MDSSRINALVAMLQAAALAGKISPSNREIADRFGYQSISGGVSMLQAAERRGLIVVHRGQANRVIAAADGSWRTKGEITRPHWRDAPGLPVKSRAEVNRASTARRRKAVVAVALPEAAPVARKPVFATPAPAQPVAARPLKRLGGVGCRYPIGEPRMAGFRYCDDAAVVPGKPYCAAHCAGCYVRLKDYAPQPGGMILPVGRAA